jgi:hypothetical protein
LEKPMFMGSGHALSGHPGMTASWVCTDCFTPSFAGMRSVG